MFESTSSTFNSTCMQPSKASDSLASSASGKKRKKRKSRVTPNLISQPTKRQRLQDAELDVAHPKFGVGSTRAKAKVQSRPPSPVASGSRGPNTSTRTPEPELQSNQIIKKAATIREDDFETAYSEFPASRLGPDTDAQQLAHTAGDEQLRLTASISAFALLNLPSIYPLIFDSNCRRLLIQSLIDNCPIIRDDYPTPDDVYPGMWE